MASKRRRLIPMFQTQRERDRAMEVLDQDEARRARRDAEKPPVPQCGWCDRPSDPDLGGVLGEVFCAEHFRPALRGRTAR
jgi:hypothetical protein